jgi:hypothetical protein
VSAQCGKWADKCADNAGGHIGPGPTKNKLTLHRFYFIIACNTGKEVILIYEFLSQ